MSLSLGACGIPFADWQNTEEPAEEQVSLPTASPSPTPSPSPSSSPNSTPITASTCAPTLAPELEDDNPYAGNSEHLDFWEYFIYEAFRGASELEFTNWLEYHHDLGPKDGIGSLSFNVKYLVLDDGTALSHGVNSFFSERFNKMQDSKEDYQQKYPNAIVRNDNQYRQIVHAGYQWGVFFTAVGAHDFYFGRVFCDPIGFNFDARTGQHLNLSDLFSVGESVYEQRLLESIQIIDAIQKPGLYPGFRDGTGEFPLPENHFLSLDESIDEYFLISPIGIVFLYPNGVVCNRGDSGQASQYVPYEKIVDILNPDLFGECLDETGHAWDY